MREMEKETVPGRWNEKELILSECVRYRAVLRQIAEHLLDGQGDAEEAVNRSIVVATKVRVPIHSRGDFRSWILRLVIDEALQLLRERRAAEKCAVQEEMIEEHALTSHVFAGWLVGITD